MATITAKTTLSFKGRILARAGKEFDSKDVPARILKMWAAKGLCSLPPKVEEPKRAANLIKESK